jgi:hypothetical protein
MRSCSRRLFQLLEGLREKPRGQRRAARSGDDRRSHHQLRLHDASTEVHVMTPLSSPLRVSLRLNTYGPLLCADTRTGRVQANQSISYLLP